MNTTESLPIHVTREDKLHLKRVLDERKSDFKNRAELASLATELERATTVESRHMPRNVVTMNSQVALIDMNTFERQVFTLVFPEDADAEKNKISVLAPVGAAMLGYRIGDEFEWPVPEGTRKFVIEKVVYQPEAKIRSRTGIPNPARW